MLQYLCCNPNDQELSVANLIRKSGASDLDWPDEVVDKPTRGHVARNQPSPVPHSAIQD